MRDRLIRERKERNLTQKEVADQLDISEVFIRKIESGSRNPSLTTISKFVTFYNVEDRELFPDIFFYKK